MRLRVLEPGLRTTIQDLGRPGLAAQGIPRSGAADRAALQRANRLLGNPPGAAALECTLGGLIVESDAHAWLVVTGVPCPITVAGRPVGMDAPFHVEPGGRVTVGAPSSGLRSYLAVHGGLATPELLGSRSQDTLSGIVPLAVGRGVELAVGPPSALLGGVEVAPSPWITDPARLRVHPGPRRDWLADQAWSTFVGERFWASSELDRVGVRLTGPPLQRRVTRELPSEAIIPGAVQLPPSGQPIIFLADHPTTGGYPVIAVVDERDLDTVAQLTPGSAVRFHARR